MEKDELHNLRHTLAHLLASAVLELYPEAKPTIGPSIENGFYYDFDNLKISDEDLPKIEKRMRKLLPFWKNFESRELSKDEAKGIYKNNPYKQELIDEINKKGERITFYKSGNFEDLCRGGHLENPSKEIDSESFKLTHVAGAYWRGDEKNKMLARIYAVAFETKEELDKYLEMLKEAQKRDHRKLGKELDLFTFSDLVGAGLPLWTPKGTIMRHLLDNFVWESRKDQGYMKVEIPHITKKDLYEKSGHWSKFGDELFKIQTREGHEFVMKPMNCPHHTQIFARKSWSYREMPQRYANTTMCYRDEQTGELHGISRTRGFAQDDAHVFCRESQIKEESLKIWDIIENFYKAFGFDLKIRLSAHDPENMDAYLGDIDSWDKMVKDLKSWMDERKAQYEMAVGEAAFYGPKIDFVAKDSLGREWQVATIQADRNMPKNFGLHFINEKGEKEGVVMIHAAIMGSLERFISVYIEHSGGNFPLWLSPVQIKILPIGEVHNKFAWKTCEKLIKEGFRVEVDDAGETLGKKIAKAKIEKIPYYMVIGDKESDSGVLKIENRGGEAKELDIDTLVKDLKKEADSRS
jgi:threonyl-tRNA synthetase